jgi:hypothetical protein
MSVLGTSLPFCKYSKNADRKAVRVRLYGNALINNASGADSISHGKAWSSLLAVHIIPLEDTEVHKLGRLHWEGVLTYKHGVPGYPNSAGSGSVDVVEYIEMLRC